jgi:proline iminopeptidase
MAKLRAFTIMLLTFALAYALGTTRLAADTSVFDDLQNNVWYLPTADGQARLYVTSIGQGPTVIVLHGGPGNDFNYLVDSLRPLAAHYRFVLFDQRGSLLSPVPSDKISQLTMTDLVNDIDTLRDALGQQKVVLFGHSFGSLLAEFYFQAHPEHVASLILAGALPPDTEQGGLQQFIRGMHKREDALRNRPVVAQTERDAGVLGASDAKLTPQQKMILFKIENASFDLYHVDRWAQFEGGGVYYDSRVDDAIGDSLPSAYSILPALKANPIPVSIIQGDNDYVDPAASLWAADTLGMSNVHIYVIKDASHYSWIDDPARFTQDMTRALTTAFGEE